MEYTLKVTLTDSDGKALVSMSLDEKYVNDMGKHPQVNLLAEIFKMMKLQHETGVPVERPKEEFIDEFIEGVEWRVKSRKGKTAEELMLMPIEEGVLVTREDVVDLKWLAGISEEEAYEKLKGWYLGA
jgi:hypothetical protein